MLLCNNSIVFFLFSSSYFALVVIVYFKGQVKQPCYFGEYLESYISLVRTVKQHKLQQQ